MVLVLLELLVLLLRRARGLRWATNAEATIKLCIIGEEGSAARTTITVRAVAAHTIPGYFLKKPPFPERAAACKWIRVSRGASESERVELVVVSGGSSVSLPQIMIEDSKQPKKA